MKEIKIKDHSKANPSLLSRIGNKTIKILKAIFSPIFWIAQQIRNLFSKFQTNSTKENKHSAKEIEAIKEKSKIELSKLTLNEQAIITKEMIDNGFAFSIFLQKDKILKARRANIIFEDMNMFFYFKQYENFTTKVTRKVFKDGKKILEDEMSMDREFIEGGNKFYFLIDKDTIYSVKSINFENAGQTNFYQFKSDKSNQSVTITAIIVNLADYASNSPF